MVQYGSIQLPIPPPKELPSFITQQHHPKRPPPTSISSSSGTVIPPPVPPQLHPFPPPPTGQPSITIAPPTPCPVTPPAPVTAQSSVTSGQSTVSSSPPAEIPVTTTESVNTGQIPTKMMTQSGNDIGQSAAKDQANKAQPTSKTQNQRPQPIAVAMSEAESDLTKLEGQGEQQPTEGNSGMFGWIQKTVTQSAFLSKVADKAKTGMDSVLTTLDPGMKDFLKSDGSVDLVIASDNGRLITAVADGFRRVFTNVTFRGMGTPGSNALLPQIIGHTFALRYAKERIQLLQRSGLAGGTKASAIVAMQPFLHDVDGTWYESVVFALQKGDVNVHVFTQPIEVDQRVIAALKEHTPIDYAANAFSTPVSIGYAEVYGMDPDDWQQTMLSFSSSELYRMACAALAAAFKRKLERGLEGD
ncbi:unnamed protein product [Anisakis simplex]|uniref:TerD domain-containing protein n=1 Tax=Anisakis simplex TaxID=6269 RepID=A0A0M3K4N9_ANISI|nr:unnamed protein product [Anisakis simplex]